MGKSLDELAAGTIYRGALTAKGMDTALRLSMGATLYTAKAYVKMWQAAARMICQASKEQEGREAPPPPRKPRVKAAAKKRNQRF